MDDTKLNLKDHDLLIEVNTTLKGLVNSVNDLKDNTNVRMVAIEHSIIGYDKLLAEFPLDRLNERVNRNEQAIKDIKFTSRVLVLLALAIGGVITWLISNIVGILKIAGR